MEFVQNPIVVEAIQWTCLNTRQVRKFLKKSNFQLVYSNDPLLQPTLYVESICGKVLCKANDWIVKFAADSFMVYPTNVFIDAFTPKDFEAFLNQSK